MRVAILEHTQGDRQEGGGANSSEGEEVKPV